MPLHYRHGFHSRLADLNKLLRYFLGYVLPQLDTNPRMNANDTNWDTTFLLHSACHHAVRTISSSLLGWLVFSLYGQNKLSS